DACGPNVDIETTLVQQSGVPPAEETSVIAVVRREFTPPFEEGVRDQNIGVSRNVRRCSSYLCFSDCAEQYLTAVRTSSPSLLVRDEQDSWVQFIQLLCPYSNVSKAHWRGA
ncbi:hypothetical protein Tco_0808124, partial [Tanacetum coccineum]